MDVIDVHGFGNGNLSKTPLDLINIDGGDDPYGEENYHSLPVKRQAPMLSKLHSCY